MRRGPADQPVRRAGCAQLEGVDVGVNVEVDHATGNLLGLVQNLGPEFHETKRGLWVLDARLKCVDHLSVPIALLDELFVGSPQRTDTSPAEELVLRPNSSSADPIAFGEPAALIVGRLAGLGASSTRAGCRLPLSHRDLLLSGWTRPK